MGRASTSALMLLLALLGAGMPLRPAEAAELQRTVVAMGSYLTVRVTGRRGSVLPAASEALLVAVEELEGDLRRLGVTAAALPAALWGRPEARPWLAAARECATAVVGFRPWVDPAGGRWARPTAAAGWWLDLGGFGKGLALRRLAARARRWPELAVLADFGGQLWSNRPLGRVAVADPRARRRPLGYLVDVPAGSVATSGTATRPPIVGSNSRPPVWRGSVTVWDADPLLADCRATAAVATWTRRAHLPRERTPWRPPLLLLVVRPTGVVATAQGWAWRGPAADRDGGRSLPP